MANAIADNLQEVKSRVEQATVKSGRSLSDCQLLVVSKTWPAEKVAEVATAGHIHFGENKVQEGIEKVPVLPGHLQWHLIGHLQSCLLYTSPSPRDKRQSRMPSSA